MWGTIRLLWISLLRLLALIQGTSGVYMYIERFDNGEMVEGGLFTVDEKK